MSKEDENTVLGGMGCWEEWVVGNWVGDNFKNNTNNKV